MQDTDLVRCDIAEDGSVATLTFNRPAAFNALDEATAASFEQSVARLRDMPLLRCVVLRGEGRAFVAGGDVRAFAEEPTRAGRTVESILRYMHPAILNLRQIDAPVIAAVHGSAAGAGLSLVLGADYAIAKRSAKFVLAYNRLGTVPDCGGSWFLPRVVGRRLALELMLAERTMTADEAAAATIVNEVVDDEAFEAAIADLVNRISGVATRAFGLYKGLIDDLAGFAGHLEREKAAFVAATATDDFGDGVKAFVEKRAPRFIGR